jgi:OOP family OmpA-OmpF porin
MKKLLSTAAVLAAIASIPSVAGNNAGFKDIVRDFRGNPVKTVEGICVLTKWEVAADQCAAKTDASQIPVTHDLKTPQPVAAPVVPQIDELKAQVYFDFNSSKLDAEDKQTLDGVVAKVGEYKKVGDAKIIGYADQVGKDASNNTLSLKRAGEVKSYLNSKGALQNAQVAALGETRPVTKCSGTAPKSQLIQCLAQDRRVDVIVQLAK